MDFEKEEIEEISRLADLKEDEENSEHLDVEELDDEYEDDDYVDHFYLLQKILHVCNFIYTLLFATLGVVSFIFLSNDQFSLVGKGLDSEFYNYLMLDLGYFLPFLISCVALLPASFVAVSAINKKRNVPLNVVSLFLVGIFFLFIATFFLIQTLTKF